MKIAGIRNMSAYIRKMAIDGYTLRLDLSDFKKVAWELSKVSTNVNQIAKRVNSGGDIYKDDIEYVKQKIDEMFDLWKQAADKLANLPR